MGLFRRKQETLNEQLLREAGLDPAQTLGDRRGTEPEPEPPATPPHASYRGRSAPTRCPVSPARSGPKEWDAVVAVRSPALAGDRIEFTTLPSGDVIVERGERRRRLVAARRRGRAAARARRTARTRRARTVTLWGVGAKRIQVAKIQFPEGDAARALRERRRPGVPRRRRAERRAVPPELERLGEPVGDDFYVEAERIDGDLWEVKVSPL